jgi:hypothetical protein
VNDDLHILARITRSNLQDDPEAGPKALAWARQTGALPATGGFRWQEDFAIRATLLIRDDDVP